MSLSNVNPRSDERETLARQNVQLCIHLHGESWTNVFLSVPQKTADLDGVFLLQFS